MRGYAGVAHLVERHLAKVEVASSSLVFRSKQMKAEPMPVLLSTRRHSQEVRQRSAKPLFPSSNLGGASTERTFASCKSSFFVFPASPKKPHDRQRKNIKFLTQGKIEWKSATIYGTITLVRYRIFHPLHTQLTPDQLHSQEVLFMNYLWSAFLGFVQGVAEFLPISSSGHLSLFQNFFGLRSAESGGLFFDVLLHLGTLISVFIYYWTDIRDMILEFFRGIAALGKPTGETPPPARRLVLLVILGTLPLFLILPVKKYVEGLGSSPVFVSFALLVTGCILFLSDRMATGRKTARSATVKDVLLVGVAQGIATIPGLSRSGCTISAGMALGFRREFAVRYSFLMSLPAVLGATLLKVVKTIQSAEPISQDMLPKYLLGMAIAGVVGYFSIRLVNLLAAKGKFGAFAYYCWAAGLVSLVLVLMKVTFIPQAV